MSDYTTAGVVCFVFALAMLVIAYRLARSAERQLCRARQHYKESTTALREARTLLAAAQALTGGAK